MHLSLSAAMVTASDSIAGVLATDRAHIAADESAGREYSNGSAGSTFCNPAAATPGLQLITAADLNNFWRSHHYGALSKGALTRPTFTPLRS